jgi:hypothetical protein
MGQYHKVVNLTKREFIDPFGLSMGQKALEQLLSEVSTQEALFVLLMCSNGRGGGDISASDPYGLIGRWAGDRIAVVGDYSENGDIEDYEGIEDVYDRCRPADPTALEQLAATAGDDLPRPANGNFLDLSPYLRPLMEQIFGMEFTEERSGNFSFFTREFTEPRRW